MNINNLINIRGQQEQAFKFAATNFKGGMKHCFTKGHTIFVPLSHALKDVEISKELNYQMKYNSTRN